MLATAFGQNPDGPGTLLRVWEQAGISGKLTVTIPGAFTLQCRSTCAVKSPGKRIALNSGKVDFQLPAYATASFLLE